MPGGLPAVAVCPRAEIVMKTTCLHITGEYIELLKLLKAAGLCTTGGMAKMAIEDGRVRVDGRTELRKRCKIRKGQTVHFDGDNVQVL